MSILDIKDEIEKIKLATTKLEQRYLHLNSIENFVFYFDKIESYQAQINILNLLTEYFSEIRKLDFKIDKSQSTYFGKKVIWEIGYYYRDYCDFKIRMSLSFVFFVGIHIDFLLLMTGLLKHIYYIPLTTASFFLYWIYSKHFVENRRKVYGIRY